MVATAQAVATVNMGTSVAAIIIVGKTVKKTTIFSTESLAKRKQRRHIIVLKSW